MAFLQILSAGANTGRKLDIESDEVSLGRASDNRLPIEDTAASSHHCLIVRDGQKYTLRDLDSTNGTLLNGLPVTESRLNPGDVITVGAVEILFDGEDIEPDTASRPEGATTKTVAKTVALGRATGAAASTPAAFSARKSRKGLWIALGIAVGLCLAALFFYFFQQLRSAV